MARLTVLDGGRREGGTVLHPTTPLSRRAGIEPLTVPAGMYVAPHLVSAMRAPRRPRAERLLRAVA